MIKANWVEFECELDGCTNTRRQRERDYNLNKHHYCSVQCLGKARTAKAISERKIITFTCDDANCTNTRTSSTSAYNLKKSHFCSMACSAKNNNKKGNPDKTMTIVCSNSGCNKTRDIYKIAYREHGNHYCSKQCSNQDYRRTNTMVPKLTRRVNFLLKWDNMNKDLYD